MTVCMHEWGREILISDTMMKFLSFQLLHFLSINMDIED